MDFELKTLTRARICTEKCDALVLLVPQNAGELGAGDDPVSQLAALAIKSGDFEGKAGKLLATYRPHGVAAIRLVLAGVGDGSPKNIRVAVLAAMGSVKNGNAKRVVVDLSALGVLGSEIVRTAVVACGDAAYVYTTTKPKATPSPVERVMMAVPSATALSAAVAGFSKGVGLAKGIALAKEWANRPANHATPTLLAGAARDLGKLPGIKVEILGPKEVAKLGMGSFMAVAQGSEEPLRFIVLRYDGAGKTAAPVVLVGKGITFDL